MNELNASKLTISAISRTCDHQNRPEYANDQTRRSPDVEKTMGARSRAEVAQLLLE